MVGDGAILPNKLVEALPGHDTLTVGIHIGSVAVAGRRPVNRDAEMNGIALARRTENEMEIARMEPVDDAAVFLVEDGAFLADGPIS